MIGELISAGTSLLGGLFGKKSSEKANAQNIAAQREFAQNGIQWKVADAKAAGLHPLAALGAQTASFSPSFVGDTSFGTGVANAGQDISRAIQSTRTSGQKLDAYTKTVQDLTLQRMGLENTLLSSQIAKANQPATPPSMPSANQRWLLDGQGETSIAAQSAPVIPVQRGPLISDQPLQRTVSDPLRSNSEPGAINDVGYAQTGTGFAPVMSGDVKDRLEEDWFGTTGWNIRNRLMPLITKGALEKGAPFKAPAGKKWWFNPLKAEYYLVDK